MYGHGGHLGHVTWTIYINFRSPIPRRLHIKFGFDWPSGFRGCLKLWTDDDDRRLPSNGYTKSSPCDELDGSGELIKRAFSYLDEKTLKQTYWTVIPLLFEILVKILRIVAEATRAQ